MNNNFFSILFINFKILSYFHFFMAAPKLEPELLFLLALELEPFFQCSSGAGATSFKAAPRPIIFTWQLFSQSHKFSHNGLTAPEPQISTRRLRSRSCKFSHGGSGAGAANFHLAAPEPESEPQFSWGVEPEPPEHRAAPQHWYILQGCGARRFFGLRAPKIMKYVMFFLK